VLLQDLDIRRHCGDAFGCQVVKRDLFMAHNVLRSLEGPASGGSPKKAVVWAHNGHVGRAPHPDGWWPMGSHLAEALGVGQIGRPRALEHLGGFEVAEYRVGPSPAGSVAHMLAQASAPLYFLPLDDVAATPEVAAWFREHREHNEYGAFAPSKARHTAEQLPLPESFDALVFVAGTHGYGFVEPGER
jgi:erythromycin esterase-like protein